MIQKHAQKCVNASPDGICRTCRRPFHKNRPWQEECPSCMGPDARLAALVKKRQATAAAQRDLFTDRTPRTKADDIGSVGQQLSAFHRAGLLGELVPLARQLAAGAGQAGITVSDLRKEAGRTGIALNGNLSCLGSVMRKAKLTTTNKLRRSDIKSTHGRYQRVWVTSQTTRENQTCQASQRNGETQSSEASHAAGENHKKQASHLTRDERTTDVERAKTNERKPLG